MFINGYDWAQNRRKLERAVRELEAKGGKYEEKDVKAVYKRLLGFVIGEDRAIPLPKEVEGLSSKELYKLAEKKEKLERMAKLQGKEGDEDESMTRKEIMAELDEKSIEYNPRANKDELAKLLE